MAIIDSIKTAMPVPVRKVLGRMRAAFRRVVLDLAIRRVAALPAGTMPGTTTLAVLRYGWGNTGWSAKPEYIAEIARRALQSRGPILECGSGLSTILLGLLADKSGLRVWALEHDSGWHERNRQTLARYGIRGVELCYAPLTAHGGFDWYSPPLERMPRDFGVVICDGPPETTPGGRYGLFPVMKDCLAADCVVLLDDTKRPGERKILERWAKENGTTSTFGGSEESYAIVTIQPS
ncbi:MAG: hypothetical protein ACYDHY_18440 [Acidiferrobacterales bacterium]